jgi:hypothetical protein
LDSKAVISSIIAIPQRKYALDILEETGMLDCKPVDTPMDPNVKLIPNQGEPVIHLSFQNYLILKHLTPLLLLMVLRHMQLVLVKLRLFLPYH